MTTKTNQTKRDKVTILLPHELVRRAKIRAAEIEVNFQDVVKLALEDYLKRKGGAA